MPKGFIKGAGTVLAIYPSKGKYSLKKIQRPKSDGEALYSDWKKVGETLYKAIKTMHNE